MKNYNKENCAAQARGQAKTATHALRTGGIQDPLLLSEWDYEKNQKSPSEFPPKSNRYAYWICSKCGYHYKAKICNRSNGRKCACCRGLVVVPGINDLATTHPQLAKEWHPTKNLPLTPEQVSYGTAKKIWWVCLEGHEYLATINHRTCGRTNCPICNSGRQTSFAEQAIFFYIKKAFPDAINRYTDIFTKGMELDIYIPSIRMGIEYDGMAWHKADKFEREIKKYNICHDHDIKLIRIKEGRKGFSGFEKYRNTADYIVGIGEDMFAPGNLNFAIWQLQNYIAFCQNCKTNGPLLLTSVSTNMDIPIVFPIDIDIKRDELEIRKYMTKIKGKSLGDLYPKLVKEWHPTKNGEITPYKIKSHSNFKAWWICPQCNNEYYASVSHRAYGTGCPKCGILKNTKSRSKPVQMIDRETMAVLRTFGSAAEASRQMKINSGNIRAVLYGKRPHAGGYFWQYDTAPDKS